MGRETVEIGERERERNGKRKQTLEKKKVCFESKASN